MAKKKKSTTNRSGKSPPQQRKRVSTGTIVFRSGLLLLIGFCLLGLILPLYAYNAAIVAPYILCSLALAGLFILDAVVLHDRIWHKMVSVPALTNGILMIASVIICLGMLEWGVALLYRTDSIRLYSAMRTELPPGTEDWRNATVMHDDSREPDPVLFWRTKPIAPYTTQRFKGPVVTVPKPDDVFRIMAYGDSNTDGLPQGAWPEQLHRFLRQVRSGDSRQYEVLNAGVAGYSSYQGLQRFREEVKTYQPDLILVSFGWNDATGTLGVPDNDYEPPGALMTGVERVLVKYLSYLALRQIVSDLFTPGDTSESAPARMEDYTPRVSLTYYTENLKAFADTARENGAAVVLLTRPYRDSTEAIRQGETWRRFRTGLQRGADEPGGRGRAYFRHRRTCLLRRIRRPCLFRRMPLTTRGHNTMAMMVYHQMDVNGLLPE